MKAEAKAFTDDGTWLNPIDVISGASDSSK